MINTLTKYLKLSGLILRYGHLRHRGENFNQNRAASLKDLQEFIPNLPQRQAVAQIITSPPQSKNTIIRNLAGQLAFLKSSLNIKGGHLTADHLSYIRIPKSASTSMCTEMLEKAYPALKQKTITEKQINFLTDANLRTRIEGSSIIFTIVRNPFSRLVSVYRDFFENKNNYIYHDYLFGILQPTLSFSGFVDRIMNIPDRLKDQHLRPQHAFLKYYEKENLSIQVFNLEEPEKLNEFLSQHGLQLLHLNKSSEHYNYRSYYNVETLAKVSELYSIDIERFGYQQVHQELIASLIPHPK